MEKIIMRRKVDKDTDRGTTELKLQHVGSVIKCERIIAVGIDTDNNLIGICEGVMEPIDIIAFIDMFNNITESLVDEMFDAIIEDLQNEML
jgi:hypothetical protein